jgi:hypothetical protein
MGESECVHRCWWAVVASDGEETGLRTKLRLTVAAGGQSILLQRPPAVDYSAGG